MLANHEKNADNEALAARQTRNFPSRLPELMITFYDQELVPSFWLTIDGTVHKRFDDILSTWNECSEPIEHPTLLSA